MHISLRAGERLFINGAVLRVDRKVSLELLNDASFLLEAHVMRVEDATTPLRQLYFVVQVLLMNPNEAAVAEAMFEKSISTLVETLEDVELIRGLRQVRMLVATGRVFDALKAIRILFPAEARITGRPVPQAPTQAA